jgi:ABC-type bacteriocin/lantibiotic exporter with double-glycine peptidase domain
VFQGEFSQSRGVFRSIFIVKLSVDDNEFFTYAKKVTIVLLTVQLSRAKELRMNSESIAATGIVMAFHRNGVSHEVLSNLDISIPHGGFVSLLGPSGVGKAHC